jgi:hypothetical protein
MVIQKTWDFRKNIQEAGALPAVARYRYQFFYSHFHSVSV